MSTDDLRDFTTGAAGAMGFGTAYDAEPSADEPDETDDELEELEGTDDDDQAEPEPGDDGTATAFWESLSPAEYAAAEASETVRQRLWDKFLVDQGYDVETEDDEEDLVEDATAPSSGVQIIQAAYADPSQLVDESGYRLAPGEWVARWVDASPAAWARAAVAAGWPATTPQPSHADLRALGHGAQGEALAASWSDHVAKLRDKGRYFGG